jgi:hypothetical protein
MGSIDVDLNLKRNPSKNVVLKIMCLNMLTVRDKSTVTQSLTMVNDYHVFNSI